MTPPSTVVSQDGFWLTVKTDGRELPFRLTKDKCGWHLNINGQNIRPLERIDLRRDAIEWALGIYRLYLQEPERKKD